MEHSVRTEKMTEWRRALASGVLHEETDQADFADNQENQSPQRTEDAAAQQALAPQPATPQQQPGSSFKERVARKMAELERSLRRDNSARPRTKQADGAGQEGSSHAAMQLPFLSQVGQGAETCSREPSYNSTRSGVSAEPGRCPSGHSAPDSSTPWAQQRRLFRDREGGSQPSSRAASVDGDAAAEPPQHPERQHVEPGDASASTPAPQQLGGHLTPMLLRKKDELSGARVKLAAARSEAQRLQLAVAREHEARQRAERRLAEAQQAAAPSSATAQLNMQEMTDLRRRLGSAEQTAESRRQALLSEKAKAQNAVGQLAIAREKVKLAQGRAERQQEAAQLAASQLAERVAQCDALQEQLDVRPGGGAAGGRDHPDSPQQAERLTDAQHECSELRQQVQQLQQVLTAAQAQLEAQAENAMSAEAAAAALELDRRHRDKVQQMETEMSRLRKAARSAEAALGKAQEAAARERQQADEAERRLLNQALEMDELQQEATCAARLADEAAELRAAEAAAQLKLAEAVREVAALRQQLSSASERAASRTGSLDELQRQLKQEQSERQQMQRALERQEQRVRQVTNALAERDAQLDTLRRDASKLKQQKTAVESWLND